LKKILFLIIALLTSLSAELTNKYPDAKLLNSTIPIVDIRTQPEWLETGLVRDAITITFFDQRGQFNLNQFLTELNQKVDTTKPFALICRTASRTGIVSKYLSEKLHYKVINLLGGMMYIKAKRLPTFPYKAK